MEKSLEKVFNEEVNNYRIILLNCAKKSEWNTFKTNAGKLFDYVESIEMSVLERKFYSISSVIIGLLILVVVALWRIHPAIHYEIQRVRELMILAGVGGCSYQLFFFLNFKTYMDGKITSYKCRRERFIKEIEADFKTY
jgi:hypothetical protein